RLSVLGGGPLLGSASNSRTPGPGGDPGAFFVWGGASGSRGRAGPASPGRGPALVAESLPGRRGQQVAARGGVCGNHLLQESGHPGALPPQEEEDGQVREGLGVTGEGGDLPAVGALRLPGPSQPGQGAPAQELQAVDRPQLELGGPGLGPV